MHITITGYLCSFMQLMMFEVSVGTPIQPDPPFAVSSKAGPSYLSAKALSSYPNLCLLSNDGSYFELNRCVLASVSPMLASTINESYESELVEDLFITTDLTHCELQIAVE